jgi:hypothetical protein
LVYGSRRCRETENPVAQVSESASLPLFYSGDFEGEGKRVIRIQEKGKRKEGERRVGRDEQGQGSDGLGSGEAVHRWDLMGDHRGEAP